MKTGFDFKELSDDEQKCCWDVLLQYRPLAFKMAIRMGIIEYEDAFHETIPELLQRIYMYDPTKSKLITWMYQVIWFALRRYKYYTPIEIPEEPSCEHFDFVKLDDRDFVQVLLSRLNKYDRELLVMYFYGSWTMEEIANSTGTCRATISNHVKRALCHAKNLSKDTLGSAKQIVDEQGNGAVGGHCLG